MEKKESKGEFQGKLVCSSRKKLEKKEWNEMYMYI